MHDARILIDFVNGVMDRFAPLTSEGGDLTHFHADVWIDIATNESVKLEFIQSVYFCFH